MASVGVLELVAHVLRIAEIKFRPNAGIAQHPDHALIVRDAVAIEHRHHDRTGIGLGIGLAEVLERGEQARHPDGEAGGRHRLAAETRHQAVVTPAAADRAEAHRSTLVVLGFESQLNLVDRTGVVFEAADNGLVDSDAIAVLGRFYEVSELAKFSKALLGGSARHVPIIKLIEFWVVRLTNIGWDSNRGKNELDFDGI